MLICIKISILDRSYFICINQIPNRNLLRENIGTNVNPKEQIVITQVRTLVHNQNRCEMR